MKGRSFMIVIKKAVPMPAAQLGGDSPLEKKLVENGLLIPVSDHLWRVKTREAMEEGELAATGDYVKLDSIGMPYPTKKDWFESNHTKVEEDVYLQKVHPLKAWSAAEPMCPEIRFLLDRELLEWIPKEGFRAELWGTMQSAGPDAIVILDRVDRSSAGSPENVEFHFVAAEEFPVSYDILTDPA